MKNKMRFYLPILLFLWSGAFAQGIAEEAESFANRIVIEAIQNESPQILLEKEYIGKMSQAEMEREAQLLLAAYHGEMVKTVYGENFYSFYGFTDTIEQYVVSDGEKINLNLVITYDEQKNTSSIVWATPFLNQDF